MQHVFTQTHVEERANALSHGLGLLLALAALPAAAMADGAAPAPLQRAGLVVFLATMLLMFGVSTVYHGLPVGAAKRRWRRWDHGLIFVFIAGTYTPFALWGLDQGVGPAPLGAAWVLAVVGLLLKLAGRLRRPLPSTAVFLGFGGVLAALAYPALQALPPQPWWLLLAGGACYTAGCGFYLLDRRLRFSHLVWHLLVLAGSACHLAATLGLSRQPA
jgi:hemolysin III